MEPRRLLSWCAVTAAAFGVIEAAVVVYLRQISYPEGFAFPLKEIPPDLLVTEIVREAATILLLLGIARLAARGALRCFAVFAYCFGVWDLVYYVGLKVFLDWPESLLTFDVLFLIPLPWTGPVLAPVLVSAALVVAGVILLRRPEGEVSFLRPVDWLVEILAGLVVLASFFWNLPAIEAGRAPSSYPWWLFFLGYGAGVAWFAWRLRKAPTGARRSLRWERPAPEGARSARGAGEARGNIRAGGRSDAQDDTEGVPDAAASAQRAHLARGRAARPGDPGGAGGAGRPGPLRNPQCRPRLRVPGGGRGARA